MSQKHRDRKDAKWHKRQDKLAAKIERNKVRRDYRGWTKLTCWAICGCCQVEFRFETQEKAEAAWKAVYLSHGSIADDDGTSEKVDGFYGCELEPIY